MFLTGVNGRGCEILTVERGSEATERADSFWQTSKTAIPNPLDGFRGLSSKTYQLENDQKNWKFEQGSRGNLKKCVFWGLFRKVSLFSISIDPDWTRFDQKKVLKLDLLGVQTRTGTPPMIPHLRPLCTVVWHVYSRSQKGSDRTFWLRPMSVFFMACLARKQFNLGGYYHFRTRWNDSKIGKTLKMA